MSASKKSTVTAFYLLVPILFSLYPVVFLYTHNVSMLSLQQLALPLAVAVILALIVLGVLQLILKVSIKASLASTLFVFLFWNYDHLLGGLGRRIGFAGWVFLLLSFALYALLVYGMHRMKQNEVLVSVGMVLLLVASVLLAFNLVQLVRAEVRKSGLASARSAPHLQHHEGQLEKRPDIYFILLDEYANFNTLADAFDYDNTAFATFLREKGFFVAENSKTRYITTPLCMAGILNLDYPTGSVEPEVMLDLLYQPETLRGTAAYEQYQEHDHAEIFALWRNNYLFGFLKDHHYAIDVLEGVSQHYAALDFPQADTHVSYQDVGATGVAQWGGNHFYMMLVRSSLLSPLLDGLGWDRIDNVHYLGTKYVLQRLRESKDSEHPRFVYAHIMSPHAPFVFDRYGNFVQQDTDALRGERVDGVVTAENTAVNDAYIEQLTFITNEMKDVIRHHFKHGRPANTIFLIMSDHGPRPHELYLEDPLHAFRILHAVYFPDEDYSGLHDAISPLNTMRVMLNQYFGKRYPMLEDR